MLTKDATMKALLISASLLLASQAALAGNTHGASQTDEQLKKCLDAYDQPLTGSVGEKCQNWLANCRAHNWNNFVHGTMADTTGNGGAMGGQSGLGHGQVDALFCRP
jgi:invasion protein IalB